MPRQGKGSALGDVPPVEGAKFHLLVKPPRRKERVVELGQDTVTIGRSDANTLPIDDTMASRFHARIELEGGAYFVIDRGSKNGTLVQGVTVKRHRLQSGDEMLIGDTRIAFISVGGDVPAASPKRKLAPQPTLSKPRPSPVDDLTEHRLPVLVDLDLTGAREESRLEMSAGNGPDPQSLRAPPKPGSIAALSRFAAILAYAEEPALAVLDAAADELFEIVECDRATIMVLDKDGEVLDRFHHMRMGLDGGEDHDAQVIQAARAIERPICLRVPRAGAGSVIGASFGVKRHLLLHPVRSSFRRAGLVALERDPARDPFDDDDLEWMAIVCAHLATYLYLCAQVGVATP